MYDNPAYVTLRPFAYIFLQLGKNGTETRSEKKKKTRSNAAGGWFVPRGRGRGAGRLLVNLVPMFDTKTMRKGTFFSCLAVRSAVIVKDQKNGIFVGKG